MKEEILSELSKDGFRAAVFDGVSNDDYHSGPGVSNSGLTALAQSPAHYWERYLNPDRKKKEPSPAMFLGTAMHAAILEPESFAADYALEPTPEFFPDALVTVNDYKALAKELDLKASTATKDELKAMIKSVAPDTQFFDDIKADLESAFTLLKQDQMDACVAIRDAVHSHPAAGTLFQGGKAEQSIYWVDADTGVLCRCRPDYLRHNAILDVKSTGDARPSEFAKSIWNYRYYVQAAFYIDGVRAAVGGRDLPFIFCAWEKEPPYACAFYNADSRMIEFGRAEYKRLLRIMAWCQKNDQWPGYSSQIENISLPDFAVRQMEAAA